MTRRVWLVMIAVVLGSQLSGCVSSFVSVAPQLPQRYADAGPARGSACGLLLFDVIPIAVNDRASRAYAAAVHETNAAAITDTAIEDSWYFALIGTVLCTEVSGQAIRETQ